MLSSELEKVERGEDSPLLNPQRRLKKRETIVTVFEVPTQAGNINLVFRTEDGLLWQLCDAGLGRTAFDGADAAWPESKQFSPLLPATIDPRPKASGPWNYEIEFGAKARLIVRLGQAPGEVVYRLRRHN